MFACYKYCHLLSGFSFKFQSCVTISHLKFVRMQILLNLAPISGIWRMKDELDDNTCKLIHK